MKIIETNGINYTGELTDELIQAIETAKHICEEYNVINDGLGNYYAFLDIKKGTNLYNSQICLFNSHYNDQQIGYFASNLFFSQVTGKQIKFIR